MAILEDENNPDYTRCTDRIVKSSWTACRHDVPEHLLFDILLWLPVTTLLQFKSICKSWHALIGSSIFIAQHFDHNCDKDNLLCILNKFADNGGFENIFWLLSGNKYEVCNDIDCGKFGFTVEIPHVELALSSNGIICLVYSGEQKVALWNPATKQLKFLPKPSVSYNSRNYGIFFGFGYDVKSDDYKVVRTIRHFKVVEYVVEVYSLKADSWRTILEDVVLPFKFLNRAMNKPMSKNGTCFWINDDVDDRETLVSFDLNDETYGTMPLPGKNESFSTYDFLGDKLAYICGLGNIEDGLHNYYYEIWVMHEYGVKESWSRVWKLGPMSWIDGYGRRLYPVGFSKYGDYLLLTNSWGGVGKLHLYDLGTEENECLELNHYTQGPYRNPLSFVCYTESLVSLKRVNDAN